ncbi:MAG TPA: hypothetical protein VG845_00535 [Dehalococcoidia bacterium]|jgi:hypothetical protein|nr:hypothetical protein [Dehalococcoidia bacterium]
MAQRVFLVQAPTSLLSRMSAAICGEPTQRRDLAREVAAQAMPHLRRVAASERIVAAVESSGKELPERWAFARNCMPYLIAAVEADEIVERIEDLTSLDDDVRLEEFHRNEAVKVGAEPSRVLDGDIRAPDEATAAAWILDRLDQAAQLRQRALEAVSHPPKRQDDSLDPVADYAISSWVWLAAIFAHVGPCFWQGRNRWLGDAAFLAAGGLRSVQNTIVAWGRNTIWGRVRAWFGRNSASDPDLQELAAVSRQEMRDDLARYSVQDLQGLLSSTASLAPVLAVEGWDQELPARGGAYLASGCVPRDRLSQLLEVMGHLARTNQSPYHDGSDWVQIVIAAAKLAERHDAHLVEADDVLPGAFRWPLFS